MKPERSIFENAVQSFDSLLSERFWVKLSDLLTCPFAQTVFFSYGPNKIQVNLSSEFYLGQYMNDPLLLRIFPRDSSEWPRYPICALGDGEIRPRFALSAAFGLWGTPASGDPHRLLTHLLCEIESRVSLLRVWAMNTGRMDIVEEVGCFEGEYFVYFQELMSFYNAQPLIFPKAYWRKQWMRLSISCWG